MNGSNLTGNSHIKDVKEAKKLAIKNNETFNKSYYGKLKIKAYVHT